MKCSGRVPPTYFLPFQVGLLPKTVDPERDIWLAYSLYLLDTYGDKTNIAKFKELKPFHVRIDFVGLWCGFCPDILRS